MIRLHMIPILLTACCALLLSKPLYAQNPAYNTAFVSSFTYQNVGSGEATLTFTFYGESGESRTVTRILPPGAGDSLFVGTISDGIVPQESDLPIAVSSDQPLAIIQVQIASGSTTVKNRPLSVLPFFNPAPGPLYAATILKNKNTNTVMTVQNRHAQTVDITAKFYNLDDPESPPILIERTNIQPGAVVPFDIGKLSPFPDVFNGSAVVTAVESGTSTPTSITGSVLELETVAYGARAMDMTGASATRLYAATALCNAFGGQTTAFAVQNINLTTATVASIHYSNGLVDSKTIAAGGKASFNTCNAPGMPSGFSGAATVTSSVTQIIGIGKATGNGLFTEFGLETVGANKLALPYVRYASDEKYENGSRQRTAIAIQNIGSNDVSNIQVRYLDKVGKLVGTHTIHALAAGQKANSRAIDAAGDTTTLLEFGSPDSNPGGGFGGGVIIEAPVGSELIAIARVSSFVNAELLAEDYNAQPID